MTPAPFHLAGERLLLDPAGALYWPARRLLALADLHLEKGSHFAARHGRFVPPYDTRETLARLVPLLRRYRPARVVALGDSFHDAEGSSRLARQDAAALHHLLDGAEAVWVRGNHDPTPPEDLPGVAAEEWREGPITFRHVPLAWGAGSAPEVAGHYHPKATLATRCGGVTRPCFVADVRRVLLPAFGAYTGGLDARDPAVAALFPRGARLFLLGRERLFSAPLAALHRPAAASMPA